MLNVEDATDQITVGQYAVGNHAAVTVENGELDLTSTQDLQGDVIATAEVNLASEAGSVNVTAQSNGNRLDVGAYYGSNMTVNATQTIGDNEIGAYTYVDGPTGRAFDGAAVSATAQGNTAALAISGGFAQGDINQSSTGLTQAGNISTIQYIPAPAHFSSQAITNVVATNGTVSGQNWNLVQRMNGHRTQASTSVSSGNAWDITAESRAAANQIAIFNQGGSVVAGTDQRNTAYVRSDTTLNSYDFGKAQSYALGYGNTVQIGNNDRYVEIDNSQFNSGGVEVISIFTGHNGYDAYVGATAVGNHVVAYACSECEGSLTADNNQVNEGDVSARSNVDVTGSGRAIIGTATATGNTATFYVTRGQQQ